MSQIGPGFGSTIGGPNQSTPSPRGWTLLCGVRRQRIKSRLHNVNELRKEDDLCLEPVKEAARHRSDTLLEVISSDYGASWKTGWLVSDRWHHLQRYPRRGPAVTAGDTTLHQPLHCWSRANKLISCVSVPPTWPQGETTDHKVTEVAVKKKKLARETGIKVQSMKPFFHYNACRLYIESVEIMYTHIRENLHILQHKPAQIFNPYNYFCTYRYL